MSSLRTMIVSTPKLFWQLRVDHLVALTDLTLDVGPMQPLHFPAAMRDRLEKLTVKNACLFSFLMLEWPRLRSVVLDECSLIQDEHTLFQPQSFPSLEEVHIRRLTYDTEGLVFFINLNTNVHLLIDLCEDSPSFLGPLEDEGSQLRVTLRNYLAAGAEWAFAVHTTSITVAGMGFERDFQDGSVQEYFDAHRRRILGPSSRMHRAMFGVLGFSVD